MYFILEIRILANQITECKDYYEYVQNILLKTAENI